MGGAPCWIVINCGDLERLARLIRERLGSSARIYPRGEHGVELVFTNGGTSSSRSSRGEFSDSSAGSRGCSCSSTTLTRASERHSEGG